MVTAPSTPRGRIAFIVSEDWFFASHFLPLLRAAQNCGLQPVVIARVRNHRRAIEEAGGRLIALDLERRNFNPFAFLTAVVRLKAILQSEKVDLVHCISLRSILLGAFAASIAGVRPRVLAITGGGFMAADKSRLTRFPAYIVRLLVKKAMANEQTQFVFENVSDPRDYGLVPTALNVTLLGGAGVDPRYFGSLPQPETPELRIALVSRMLWSKGPDVAVAAVELARSKGCDVRLSLYGAPDASNPKAISLDKLREWSNRDGIEWHGPIADVREVWAKHHVACLPSRGGEGLPRTILEAAACERALLTTDVPGCRDFIRAGQEGWLVPVDDVQALADHMCKLFNNRELVASAGRSARSRVLDGFTEDDVVNKMGQLYRNFTTQGF